MEETKRDDMESQVENESTMEPITDEVIESIATETVIAEEPGYQPKTIQKVVGKVICAGFVILLIISLLRGLGISVFDRHSGYYVDGICYSLMYLIVAGGLGLLLKDVNNKATKVAIIMIIVLNIWASMIGYLRQLSFYWHFLDQENLIPEIFISSETDYRYSELASFWTLVLQIQNYFYFVEGVLWLYAISLLLINNEISSRFKNWINLLIVCTASSIFWSLYFFWNIPISEATDRYGFDWLWGNEPSDNLLYIYFVLSLIRIALAGGYLHLAQSEVFSGEHPSEDKSNFSPLNKYMAAGIIAPVLMALGIFLLYSNYEAFM